MYFVELNIGDFPRAVFKPCIVSFIAYCVISFKDLNRILMDRQRSQLLGIIILAALFLLLACIRYYFKLG